MLNNFSYVNLPSLAVIFGLNSTTYNCISVCLLIGLKFCMASHIIRHIAPGKVTNMVTNMSLVMEQRLELLQLFAMSVEFCPEF